MKLLPLLFIYAIGAAAICGYPYFTWRMARNHSISVDCINLNFAVTVGVIVLPIILPCMYITALDAQLWVNRELTLNITCLAGMYGPANDILR